MPSIIWSSATRSASSAKARGLRSAVEGYAFRFGTRFDCVSTDIPRIHIEEPSANRVGAWLDWWCSSRWRALLIWIALNGVLVGLLFFGFFRELVGAVDAVARSISQVVYVVPTVRHLWDWIAVGVVISG